MSTECDFGYEPPNHPKKNSEPENNDSALWESYAKYIEEDDKDRENSLEILANYIEKKIEFDNLDNKRLVLLEELLEFCLTNKAHINSMLLDGILIRINNLDIEREILIQKWNLDRQI